MTHLPPAPVELSTFLGRERELGELTDLFGRSRLLTLTGAGGSGKTRLARQLVSRARRPDEDLAWVELAALAQPFLLPTAVAEAAGGPDDVPDAGGWASVVGSGPLLLVLDNCEHLVDACAELAGTLLAACPAVRILATSREALGVSGERAWLVPPLSLPPATEGPVRAADVAGSEAVRLFVERAREVAPDFELTDAVAADVAEVCRRLDGIPLAIELAAARARLLAPAQIRERLDDAFRLLGPARRTAVPRHRTLAATMDWSHDLLRDEARVLLRRLAVFRGGFTLGAAEAVAAGDGLEEAEVLDTLGRLVDRSLVDVRPGGPAARYVLLETVRQYAWSRLEEAGEADDVRRRHAAFHLALAREAEPHLRGEARPAWTARLEPELDNLREALSWSRRHDRATHVRLAGSLTWLWYSTRHWSEAARWTAGAMDALVEVAAGGALEGAEAGLSPGERAALLFASGSLAALQGRGGEAVEPLREAAALARQDGDACLEAWALNYLGMAHGQGGSQEGVEPCRKAAAWFREAGDLYGLRLSHLLLGTMAAHRGDLDEALRENLEGVAVARRFGQPRDLGVSLQNTALVHLLKGDMEEAERLARESLAALAGDPSPMFEATSVEYLGEVRGRRGRPLDAALLLGAGEATREVVSARRFPINQARLDALIPALRDAAGAGAWDEAWRRGRELGVEGALGVLSAGTDGGVAVAAAVTAAATAAATAERAAVTAGERGGSEDGARGATHPEDGGATRLEDGGATRLEDGGATRPEDGGAFHLRVRALGPFEVEVDGRALTPDAWSIAKPREMLVLLLLSPQGVARDRLARALWPDAPPAQLKNSFHVALHHLRRTLGHPEWVVLDGDRYRIAPSVRWWLDAVEFEAGVGRMGGSADLAGVERALSLWRGELLEDCPAGPWATEHRDRLGALRTDALLARGAALELAGDHAAAADAYRSVVLRDDLHEEAHRRLMAAWSRSGQRSRALRHFDELAGLLRSELDTDPEPATVALYEELRAVPVTAGGSSGSPAYQG